MTRKIITKTTKILSGLTLGGALLGAALSRGSELQTPQAEPIEPRVEAPIAQAVEAIPQPLTPKSVEVKPEIIEIKKPKLAIDHTDDLTDFLAQGRKELDAGELKKAFVSFRKHLKHNAADADVLLMMGSIGRQLKENALAELALSEAIKLDDQSSALHLELARVYFGVKEYDKAHDEARRAAKIDRENSAAWNLQGRVAMAQSQWQRAEIAMRHAVELEPSNAMIHNNLGLLYIYMRDANSAIDSLETAVELFEDDTPHFVYNNLGLAHEMAKNHEEAREAFEEALLIRPFYAKARVNLKRVETAIEKLEEKSAFETAEGLAITDVDVDDT